MIGCGLGSGHDWGIAHDVLTDQPSWPPLIHLTVQLGLKARSVAQHPPSRYPTARMRPSKLTPEQEGEVYRRAKAGESYASIQTWLAGQGVTLAKSSISEVIPRVERRALAAQPEAPPDEYIDPHTGAVVAISDAAILGHMQRSMVAEFLCPGHPRSSRLAAAAVVARLMLTRRRLSQMQDAQRR